MSFISTLKTISKKDFIIGVLLGLTILILGNKAMQIGFAGAQVSGEWEEVECKFFDLANEGNRTEYPHKCEIDIDENADIKFVLDWWQDYDDEENSHKPGEPFNCEGDESNECQVNEESVWTTACGEVDLTDGVKQVKNGTLELGQCEVAAGTYSVDGVWNGGEGSVGSHHVRPRIMYRVKESPSPTPTVEPSPTPTDEPTATPTDGPTPTPEVVRFNISHIECVDRNSGDVEVHFVTTNVDEEFTFSNVSYNMTIPSDENVNRSAVFNRVTGDTAHFADLVRFGNGTYTLNSASVSVNDQLVELSNPGESFEVKNCEPEITPSATPTEVPSPTPTEEPEPTETPSPTPTQEPSPTPTDEPTPTQEPSPTPTDEPSPTPTETPIADETQLKLCKYQDDNANGERDFGDKVLSWSFQYTVEDQDPVIVDSHWWNIFTQGCAIVDVPTEKEITVEEISKDGWRLTALWADGQRQDEIIHTYTSDVDDVKVLWFFNTFTPEEPKPSPTPTPSIEPSPTPEPTVEPTATPTLEPTKAPTATPTEEPKPTDTPSPSPTDKPEPTVTPTDEPAPTATATPAPSATPTEGEQLTIRCVNLEASAEKATAPATIKFTAHVDNPTGGWKEFKFGFDDTSGGQPREWTTTDREAAHRYEEPGRYIATVIAKADNGQWYGGDDCMKFIDITDKPQVLGDKTPDELPKTGAGIKILLTMLTLSVTGAFLFKRFRLI